MLSKDLTRTR